MKQTLCLLAAALLLTACEGDNMAEPQQALVVEGWIDDGGFPVVMLTQSLPVSEEEQSMDDLNRFLLKWAKVTVSDGEDSVTLTGKYDNGYFPPYIYTTGRMRGRAGKRYALSVEYRDMRATAVTTIPEAPVVEEYRIERCAGSDTLYQITVCLMDNKEERNYYQILTRTGTESKQFLASYLGCIDDAVLDGRAEIPVYRGHHLTNKDYTPYFSVNDTVSVKVARIDREAFLFWNEYIKSQSLSNNMFLSTSDNIPSNISGGLGYWCGYGATTAHFVIKDFATRTASGR